MTFEQVMGETVDLEPIGNHEWMPVGGSPSVLFKRGDLLAGWVRMRFRYTRETGNLGAPALTVVIADGSTVNFRLDWSDGEHVDHVVYLPTDADDITLRFLGVRGRFAFGPIQVQAIGRLSAIVRIISRTWRRKRSDDTGNRLAVLRRTLSFVRQQGLSAARNRLVTQYHTSAKLGSASQATVLSYHIWTERFGSLTLIDIERIKLMIDQMTRATLISVVMPVYNTPERWLRAAIESVRAQLYPHWELCIANDRSTEPHVRRILDEYEAKDKRIRCVHRDVNGHISAATNSAIELAGGDWIAFLDHDDELRPESLFAVAYHIQENPQLRVIYSDEDKISENGRRYDPHFKPDYNPELFLSQNYINHLTAIDSTLVDEVGGFREGYEGAQDYDLLLRCVELLSSLQIYHIPLILYSWRSVPGSTAVTTDAKKYAENAAVKALEDHYKAVGIEATVEAGLSATTYRTKIALSPKFPLVSIIIPTRDGVGYVRQCIKSIYERTSYANYEILLVDNDSTDPASVELIRWLEFEGLVRVVRRSGRFNYSLINNSAVQMASGEIVCLLNNDTEVISPNWLEEMVSLLQRPGVGIVGAKLLYPDRSVQHAGAILGIGGVAGHGHKHFPPDSPGYFSRLSVVHEVGAVTGACLLVRRDVYLEVGGLDAKWLPVAFNDIDFCLRVRDAGHRVVWTPHAELFHHESKTRGLDDTPQKLERLATEAGIVRSRWGDALLSDPSYSPNLSLESEGFEYADEPRYLPPWIKNPPRRHMAEDWPVSNR